MRHPTTCSLLLDRQRGNLRYLQVVDMFLGVKVNPTGPFLYGHHGEAHIDTAVKFPFLYLNRQHDKDNLLELAK